MEVNKLQEENDTLKAEKQVLTNEIERLQRELT